MHPIVWIAIWATIIGTIAYFLVREIRSGRKRPAEVERMHHAGAGEAELKAQFRRVRGQGGV